MAFRTLTAKFAGKCKRCTKAGLSGDFPAGTKIRWAKGAGSFHFSDDCPASGGGSSCAVGAGRSSGASFGGRCEDAPCCGHSACGFGPGVPGYGSNVGGSPYYGEDAWQYNEDLERVALGLG